MLDRRRRYLQLAFNGDEAMVRRILPGIPASDRIFIEAGTPYIKREGLAGIRLMRELWAGTIVADLKTTDGAVGEVEMVHSVGASAATVLGSAPPEVLERFIRRCRELNMLSMIDMLGVNDPLHVLRDLHVVPDVMVLHRGRDEEQTRGKVIEYRHVNRVLSKYNVFISAAGGVDLKEARSAIFNGAGIVVANLVRPGEAITGIRTDENVAELAQQFLATIA
ncbi:MAG: hypothetical protein HC915_13135 [Anaerolineae bacterium]|nr:hypothetical protein [Anaerolineae bacterium]